MQTSLGSSSKDKLHYEFASSFNEDTIYDVYAMVSKDLLSYTNMELGVLQAFSYCLYELADNVLNHSMEQQGTLEITYSDEECILKVAIKDNGLGIWNSLRKCKKYFNISEEESLKLCIEDGVTDGKGRGFGLYSTSLLIKNTNGLLNIFSGNYKLTYCKNNISTSKTDFCKGTKVYLVINTNIDMPANKILADRADGENEFNESFLAISPFEDLW